MFNTHFCLVSAQAAPNLLPMLDLKFKPKEVVLLVTPAMKEKADHLQAVIQPLGISVRQEPFSATGNFQAMQKQLEDLLRPYASDSAALNVTGGNKWMAITAQEVFRFNNRPVFYVDIESGQLLFLDSHTSPHNLDARIKLVNYLKAYGYSVNSEQQACGLTHDQRELCHQMVWNVTEWGAAIGQLNRLANEAESKKDLGVSLSILPNKDPSLMKLLQECSASKILTIDATNKIHFSDDKARFFANGGWLEEYINARLNELKAEGLLQDSSHLNLKVASPKSTNEIDVAFMAKNRLHIIECKTKRLTGMQAGSAGTESLYKLDSISELGGLGTKSMLVSYRDLGAYDLQRAKDLNIKVVKTQEIQQIKNTLRTWIG